MCMTRYRNKIW